jgi:glycosyltransferase involved in cell wall biosynthesis
MSTDQALIPVAFYAPLKAPDHATPSGDRRVARLLLAALQEAGFSPVIASRLRMLDRSGDPSQQNAMAQAAQAEAAVLIDAWRKAPPSTRPRVWLTYHCYYKAPDIIGPLVAKALSIPYVIAEGSRASKRANGPWAASHVAAEAALDAADLLFVSTNHDKQALLAAKTQHQRLADLPPFIDLEGWNAPTRRENNTPVRLLCVAMMREGAKLASYCELAKAMALLPHGMWSLTIVGDGPARDAVGAAFARYGKNIIYCGQVEDQAALGALYAQADIFVWPAVDEAYGMVFLEAQAMGLPIIAGRHGGVSSVVDHGIGGLLTLPGDIHAFGDAVASLIKDANKRTLMGRAGQNFVRTQRTLSCAATIIRNELSSLLQNKVNQPVKRANDMRRI